VQAKFQGGTKVVYAISASLPFTVPSRPIRYKFPGYLVFKTCHVEAEEVAAMPVTMEATMSTADATMEPMSVEALVEQEVERELRGKSLRLTRVSCQKCRSCQGDECPVADISEGSKR
jgi:hypothetical protein